MNNIVSYYDAIAAEYDNSRFGNSYGRFIDAEERRILNRIIGEKRSRQILEMACGTGRLTGYATHVLYVGEEMMAFARKRPEDVQFVRASAMDSGFSDEMFDVVYSFHLLMHLDVGNVRQFIDEAYRILKPGGCLIIDIPSGKRRRLLRHERRSWHGSTALTSDELRGMITGKFSLHRSFGIMMLPVHRLPESLRRRLLAVDYALANGCLKEYSSYVVFELIKKK